MALLGIFARREKAKSAPEPSKASTSSSEDASHLSAQNSPNSVYSGPAAASSSKLMLGFRGKKSHPPASAASALTDDNGFLRPPDAMTSRPPRFSSSKSESGHDYLGPPPSRADLFSAYGEPSGARSTRSLPTPTPSLASRDGISLSLSPTPSADPSPAAPQKKSKGMFAWAHRERKRSKTSAPSEVIPSSSPEDSFNLKSFRHVRPVSPSPLDVPRPPSALSAVSTPQRPRGNSIASVDSSQRISVAAFREMAARRSTANSPSPSSPDMAGSPFTRPPSGLSQTKTATSPNIPGRRSVPRTPASPTSDSTSEESDIEEDDEDADSADSSTLRPMRNNTITPRSAAQANTSSELGQRTRPTPPRMAASSSAQSGTSERESVYSRTRASRSTSALMPNAAARRASMLAAAKAATADSAKKLGKKPATNHDSDSDSDSSSSSDASDSDDAPLAKYVPPKRPGSSTSNATNTSRSRVPTKPLIDISGLTPPPLQTAPEEEVKEKGPTPPVKEKMSEKEREKNKENISESAAVKGKEKEKDKTAPSPVESTKPTLNDRLSRLAQSVAAARSTNNLDVTVTQESSKHGDGKDKPDRGLSPLRQPKRSQTAPVDQFVSPVSASTSASSSGSSTTPPAPPSPTTKMKLNGRSMSTPNAVEGIKDLSDPKPIVPTPIRERSPPPAFSVTSRPASQLGLASHSQLLGSSQSSQQPTVRVVGSTSTQSMSRSPPPSETSSGSRSVSSPRVPLIADSGIPPSKGFTGGGLLAGAATNPSTEPPRASPALQASFAPRASPVPSNSSSPAMRAARHRAATVGQSQSSLSLSPREDTAAPVPVRPFTLRSAASSTSGGGRDTNSQVSSSSVSSLSNSSAPTAQFQSGATSKSNKAISPQARTRSSTVGNSGMAAPPVKPFATGFRGNSPASSTGESSSGRTPITPIDGSEVSYAPKDREVEKAKAASAAAARRAHRKSASVTFDEPERERGRAGARERERERDRDRERQREEQVADAQIEESRRRERRRSEAKAALELGRIVNGHGPVVAGDDEEEDRPLDNMPPRMSMMSSTMGMPMHNMSQMNMNITPASPMVWQSPQPGMLSPQQFMFPMVPPSADPNFLAAHQQAMMVAKQAYQMAVAQQAMAAAEEEWERGSTAAASVLGGGGANAYGASPMNRMFSNPTGFGMGMGMGMQGGWGGMMFPSSAQSMYAGSVAGSELGVNGRGGGWGSRSAYGDPSGNDRASMLRSSGYGFQPPPMPPRSESFGQMGSQLPQQRPGPRPRTKTAPTGPPSEAPRRPPPPPSSWKAGAPRPA